MSKEILIVNDGRDAGGSYTPFYRMLDGEISNDIDAFFLKPERFDLVAFTGGADVKPELYGDTSPKLVCHTNPDRDRQEVKVFNVARNNDVGMFGICRGLQFINVMAGGKMIHDLTGHQGNHMVMTCDDESFEVNSLHHQACIPPINAEVLAWSAEKRSRRYLGNEDEPFDYHGPEVESVHFPEVKAAGVQWHPEIMQRADGSPRGLSWAYLLARDIIRCNNEGMRKLYYVRRPRINYVK